MLHDGTETHRFSTAFLQIYGLFLEIYGVYRIRGVGAERGDVKLLSRYTEYHLVCASLTSLPLARPTSTGVLAPGFSSGRDDSGVLQLRIAQLVSHGFRAGQGGFCRGSVVPGLR